MTRLKEKYKKRIAPEMKKLFGYKNDLAVPKIEKVTVNIGAGKVLDDPKFLEKATESVTLITGQKPLITRAKKSISGFKIKEGMAIGLKVTLRGKRMEEFIDKLINVALPRVRDFRGLSVKGFDRSGNYTVGLKEETIFPEIFGKKKDFVHGLEVTIVTTTKNKKEAKKILELLGFPFKKE